MEKYTEILQFLDGTLSHDEEAELLHLLSVSPERRDVLRNYIDQRSLFQRDREAINVPYGAEQKLWARLGELMPVGPAATVTSGTTALTATHGFRWVSVLSVGTVCVILGLLSGFYLGRNTQEQTAATVSAIPQTILSGKQASDIPAEARGELAMTPERMVARHRFEAPLAETPIAEDINRATPVAALAQATDNAVGTISSAELGTTSQSSYKVLEPREGSHSLAELMEATQQQTDGGILHRMELNFAESFGKQFPHDAASRNTQPLITNSTISGLYQAYRGPIEIWAGIDIGSANLAKRSLREELVNANGSKLVADVAHTQTTWFGLLAQGRHPLSQNISVTASAGVSYSSLGPLFHGELGGRYRLTDQVGITMGLRSLHLHYDLTQEENDVIARAVYPGDLGVNHYGSEWSHNLEFTTGMYFHF